MLLPTRTIYTDAYKKARAILGLVQHFPLNETMLKGLEGLFEEFVSSTESIRNASFRQLPVRKKTLTLLFHRLLVADRFTS